MSSQPTKAPATRLRFIDMARSIAILLMLEGHFIDLALAPEWRQQGYWPYEIWLYIRGMAAPMFFTGTGLVFAYLLNCRHEEGFWQIVRVRKGLIRATELIFWGYLLQVNLRHLPDIFSDGPDSWVLSFHVLQCIGVGLFLMIFWYGLLRRMKVPVLGLAYAATGFGLYVFHIWLQNHDGHFPLGAPAWVQNSLKGPHSVFPIAPWLGFTFYGAALGVWVRRLGTRLWRPTTPLFLIGIGLVLRVCGLWFDGQLGGELLMVKETPLEFLVIDQWFHNRVGEVFILLGLLIAFEIRYQPGDSWFLTIGRNTFPIYVGHVMILYGGLFGVGLRSVLTHQLNPWQSLAGALLFMAFFAWMAQWVAPTRNAWEEFKTWLGLRLRRGSGS